MDIFQNACERTSEIYTVLVTKMIVNLSFDGEIKNINKISLDNLHSFLSEAVRETKEPEWQYRKPLRRFFIYQLFLLIGSTNSGSHFADLNFHLVNYILLTSVHYSKAGTTQEMTKGHLQLSRVWIVQMSCPRVSAHHCRQARQRQRGS